MINNMLKFYIGAILTSTMLLGHPIIAHAQGRADMPPLSTENSGATYVDLADIILSSPIIIDGIVTKEKKVPASQTPFLDKKLQRKLVELQLNSLIRGKNGMPATVRFVMDVRANAKGKFPKFKKQRIMVFGDNQGLPMGDLRLLRPDIFFNYDPQLDRMVRNITKEALLLDAPQKITGVQSAYHSSGTIIGTGLTEIFFATEKGQPLAILIDTDAQNGKSWSVSNEEVLGSNRPIVRQNTLLWYRLACELPQSIATDKMGGDDKDIHARIQSDYAFVRAKLGKCERTLSPPLNP
ncbi:hypothetical protein LPB140_04185 [Sphingorhabdus lutea]|uniref:Uncharacterized protein n=1 Tax=Sphingorhabdus lutea TaxID=1913578 RepID=A0A1L3JAI1_9SPHN|nr:hypothetical protein [Sphingorhabdus lutea]APG62136.1 hypothetical protein LPB140_04185 [Sphingorhabdus lutea]